MKKSTPSKRDPRGSLRIFRISGKAQGMENTRFSSPGSEVISVVSQGMDEDETLKKRTSCEA